MLTCPVCIILWASLEAIDMRFVLFDQPSDTNWVSTEEQQRRTKLWIVTRNEYYKHQASHSGQ